MFYIIDKKRDDEFALGTAETRGDAIKAARRWYGVACEGDAEFNIEEPIEFGDMGYYGDWE